MAGPGSNPPDAPPGEPPEPGDAEDAPPILGTWRNVYVLVLASLVLAIAGLTLFSRVYR